MKDATKFNKILGVLYGQAYGDTMGMPGELWTKNRVECEFGWINTMLSGHYDNIASSEFVAGQFTDDTAQAIALMDSLIESGGLIIPEVIAKHILKWAESVDAFNKNILGPNSKSTLLSFKNGLPINKIIANGTTNGAAMRSSPLGCLLPTFDVDLFIEQIALASSPTHKSDIAIAGAVTVAWAISRLIDGISWQQLSIELPIIANKAQEKYLSTYSPLLGRRIEYAISIANKIIDHKEGIQLIYDCIGTGMETIETVPAAIALVIVSQCNPILCAELAANLGGDSDTIGAIACAMCGAISGREAFDQEIIDTINSVNEIDFSYYADKLIQYRSWLEKQ